MSSLKVTGVTPATTIADLMAAAMPPTTTAARTTTAAPTTTKPGACPSNYLPTTVPNPDLDRVYDGASTGDGYKVTGNENYYIKLPAQLASVTNFNGWNVCVNGGDLPANKNIRVKVKAYAKGVGPNGFDAFKFTPTLPGLFGNHQMAFFFAPTMTGGRRGSRRGRKGRKGTRRH